MTLAQPFKTSPASRVAIGLVTLMVPLLLMSDFFVGGFLGDRREEARRHHLLSAELIATQVTLIMRDRRDDDLKTLLFASMQRDPALRSAAVYGDGRALAVAGDHAHRWHLTADAPSTLDELRTPLLADGQPWGELQLAFDATEPADVLQWLESPRVAGLALASALGFFAFQLYLRRAMRYLDPSAAVPERVRTAFDTLVEAVMVLDTQGRIMLANQALQGLGPDRAVPIGTRAADLAWLVAALPDAAAPPWLEVQQSNRPMLGIEMRIDAGAGRAREVVLNCSPINDGFRRARGCLVTLSDVTELHDRTEGLRSAMEELRVSREEIRLKNEELTLLATRDPLTGCLNRRAFLAESERCIAAAMRNGTPLCCVMGDVDHFKSVNDRYGHGGGDEVLKAVAKALGRGLRNGDWLGRYGGEEFCVLLPGANLEEAMAIAERLRADVQTHAGSAVRHLPGLNVTISLGVAQLGPESMAFEALVDHADQALYDAKKNGRNRVTSWASMAERTAPAAVA